MPGHADALRDYALIVSILGQLPGQRPPAFWLEVARLVCQRHQVASLRPDTAQQPGHTLTRRQRDILQTIADGKTVTQTATHHGIHTRTLQQTLGRARRQLGATTTTHAVALAIRNGCIR